MVTAIVWCGGMIKKTVEALGRKRASKAILSSRLDALCRQGKKNHSNGRVYKTGMGHEEVPVHPIP